LQFHQDCLKIPSWRKIIFLSVVLSRKHIVLTGIECHVCVYQTALDLISIGYNVHLVSDAVSSRTPENRQIGIDAIKSAGAHITSTEMVLFELLRTAADPKFKEIIKIVK